MPKKTKLCKMDCMELERDPAFVLKLVKKPKYICSKCLRVAKNNKVLCKAVALDDFKLSS